MSRAWWVVVVLMAGSVRAQDVTVSERLSSLEDLTPKFERFVLPNGLVVLLSPDAQTNSVLIDLSFAAGAMQQPAGKVGLAHLTEHVFASLSSGDVDYRGLLERRGATGFNATTSFDRMSFRVSVPPEELPLALWVNADRMGSAVADALTDDEFKRHQRIVVQERLYRVDDAAYGGTALLTMRALFPIGHPLHDGVGGGRDDINGLLRDDVITFARTHFVPANGVLTIVGRFEPEVARTWVTKLFAPLLPGKPASTPPSLAAVREMKLTQVEQLGRQPKIIYAWTVSDMGADVNEALTFGSLLFNVYTDGFVGLRVHASFVPSVAGGAFILEVTMPQALDRAEAEGNAEGVYRYLSRTMVPKDITSLTLLAWDRRLMEQLHSPDALASLLVAREVTPTLAVTGFAADERHWGLTPDKLLNVIRAALPASHVSIHAKPTRPLPPRVRR